MTDEGMTQLAINTIRTLSIDAVQQAKSGHPGTPMALAGPNKDKVLRSEQPFLPMGQIFASTRSTQLGSNSFFLIMLTMPSQSARSRSIPQPIGHTTTGRFSCPV
jgi:hypothetical protein